MVKIIGERLSGHRSVKAQRGERQRKVRVTRQVWLLPGAVGRVKLQMASPASPGISEPRSSSLCGLLRTKAGHPLWYDGSWRSGCFLSSWGCWHLATPYLRGGSIAHMGSFHLLKTLARPEWTNVATTASGGGGPDARAAGGCTRGPEDTEETAGQSKSLIRGRTASGRWIREPSGLPRWLSGKGPTCSAGDVGSIPGLGRSHMPQSI